MLFLDVKVCIHAMRPQTSEHAARVREWVEAASNGPVPVGVSEFVLSSMIQIVTQRRVFRNPSSPEEAVAFGNALLDAPSVSVVRPGPRHWSIFGDLVTTHRLRGNDVPDAYLAAVAIGQGATMVTLDRGFAQFEGLRTLNPLA